MAATVMHSAKTLCCGIARDGTDADRWLNHIYDRNHERVPACSNKGMEKCGRTTDGCIGNSPPHLCADPPWKSTAALSKLMRDAQLWSRVNLGAYTAASLVLTLRILFLTIFLAARKRLPWLESEAEHETRTDSKACPVSGRLCLDG